MFCTPNYLIIEVNESDIIHIAKIYNSNQNFLRKHIGVERISEDWVLNEIHEMRENGFLCCMIIDKNSALPVGFLEFKISEETYLSLIMINSDNKKNGIGKEIIQYFSEYVKHQNSSRIRIDVVADYDESVLKFWINNGFIPEKENVLSWCGKKLHAIKMVKDLMLD